MSEEGGKRNAQQQCCIEVRKHYRKAVVLNVGSLRVFHWVPSKNWNHLFSL